MELGFCQRLLHHAASCKTKSPEEADADVEEHFRAIEEKEFEEEKQRCPSLRQIPKFFTRTSEGSLQQRCRREARQRLLARRTEELAVEEDLHKMHSLLRSSVWGKGSEQGGEGDEVIDYEGFCRVRDQLPEKFWQYFLPQTFMKFNRDQNGCIAIATFFRYVVRKVNNKQTRIQLSYYDTEGFGYLRENNMENLIFDLVQSPHLEDQFEKLLPGAKENFYPFYVFTAVRKFFFFLDPFGTKKIRIRDLLVSPHLKELYVGMGMDGLVGDAEASKDNWFSVQSALRVYMQYLELDQDRNGLLSPDELQQYGSGMLTRVFVQRVFEECQTYSNEMDYKTFLGFVLAMESVRSPSPPKQAIHYFWKLFDIHHAGYIDSSVINYFFRAVAKELEDRDAGDKVSPEDVNDEIFDIVQPVQPTRITLEDLNSCNMAGTVLSMLIDAHAFLRYDNREKTMQDDDDEDGDF
eukprot:CAMPEP_0204349602 /NCGR_PEP_ID=MMETSP0469-20131031/29655_1 /ASSEMBLY_ACC=CAM_ASM_000384 /TAXON_ID=2969 /ORGANISM="Oxyrrhis marina" /LENGTH=463 /DNA_ID=CAMNT_0051335825 /DNA_START=1 /DNA_END=1392 /DNA_ORIENTATION=+